MTISTRRFTSNESWTSDMDAILLDGMTRNLGAKQITLKLNNTFKTSLTRHSIYSRWRKLRTGKAHHRKGDNLQTQKREEALGPPPSKAMIALAQFDPVIARALAERRYASSGEPQQHHRQHEDQNNRYHGLNGRW